MPYILGILLLQYYSADLLSHLTVKDLTPPFQNLKGVIDDDSYEIAGLYPSKMYDRIYVSESQNFGRKFSHILFRLSLDLKIFSLYFQDSIIAEGGKEERLKQIDYAGLFSGDVFHDLCTYHRVIVIPTTGYNTRVNCSVVELLEPVAYQSFGFITKKGYPYRDVMAKL